MREMTIGPWGEAFLVIGSAGFGLNIYLRYPHMGPWYGIAFGVAWGVSTFILWWLLENK